MSFVPGRAAARLLVAAGLALLATTACSGPSDPADAPAVLVTQPDFRPGATPPCLEHQAEEPNAAYQGGETSQPVPQLTFLAYYTAAGRAPFCDREPATDTDRMWGELYVRLTGNRDGVSSVLG